MELSLINCSDNENIHHCVYISVEVPVMYYLARAFNKYPVNTRSQYPKVKHQQGEPTVVPLFALLAFI